MITPSRVVILIIVLWAFIYTLSYGRWAWKGKNKLGAIALYILALIVLGLPVYVLYTRG